ncbi:MAG: hypothetical protein JSS81_28045 [Acidobacteria bacterium]|nr:hypothetical protein [Acidobacteriota bacterium]
MKYWFFTIQKTAKRDTMSTEEVLPILHSHTAYFKELGKAGACLMAGPFADQKNNELGAGCYVLTAETEEEARKLADADPFCVHGIYEYKIWEWQKVVPE